MKTANPFIDNMVESQTNFINNWMDSAKKFQAAFTNGNAMQEGQNIYKEWLDKQTNILNSMKDSNSNLFNANSANPQEFFKNWLNQQATYAKQMADFNQSIFNSYNSFGKPAQEYMNNYNQMNNAFTNIHNSWMNTLNSSFDTMSKNMNGTFNKDIFNNFVQGNQLYAKMQEFFQPMADAIQKGQFNYEAFKNYFNAEHYSKLSNQIFGNLYNGAPIKEVYDNAIKQVQNFFVNQNNLGKEYYAQMSNISNQYPQLFTGNYDKVRELYSQVNNVFGKTFEPLLKMVNPGKEKENIENTILLMDKLAEYSIKQAELQSFLQNTTQKSMEKVAKQFTEKMQDPANLQKLPGAQDIYNEWIKINEELFSQLFASEEFSKVKAETLSIGADVKKQFENQFVHMFEAYPLVFKNDLEELHQTIYDLKKQVKELQTKLAISNSDLSDEEKTAKNRKK